MRLNKTQSGLVAALYPTARSRAGVLTTAKGRQDQYDIAHDVLVDDLIRHACDYNGTSVRELRRRVFRKAHGTSATLSVAARCILDDRDRAELVPDFVGIEPYAFDPEPETVY